MPHLPSLKSTAILAAGFVLGLGTESSIRFGGLRPERVEFLPPPTLELTKTGPISHQAVPPPPREADEAGKSPVPAAGDVVAAFRPAVSSQAAVQAAPQVGTHGNAQNGALGTADGFQMVISGNGPDGAYVSIPAGTRLPAILVDLDQSTGPQAAVADSIAGAFVEAIAAPPADATQALSVAPDVRNRRGDASAPAGPSIADPRQPVPSRHRREDLINSARAAADGHYWSIFGQDAYSSKSMAAALQSMGGQNP